MENFLKSLKFSYGRNECVEKLVSNTFSTDEISSIIYELQENIVSYILNDELINKYETNVKYQKKFLKTLISFVEKHNEEVNSVIFEKYIDLINRNTVVVDRYYRIYYSKVSEIIEILVIFISFSFLRILMIEIRLFLSNMKQLFQMVQLVVIYGLLL
jgi:hypothetical protein